MIIEFVVFRHIRFLYTLIKLELTLYVLINYEPMETNAALFVMIEIGRRGNLPKIPNWNRTLV